MTPIEINIIKIYDILANKPNKIPTISLCASDIILSPNIFFIYNY